MSLFSSMYIGMSGMRANEHAITVIGDNIANMNTIGFKSNRWGFSDMLSHQMIGPTGSFEVGQGAMITGSQRILTQGALLGTGLATDLAIAGTGYFVVDGSVSGIEGDFYTRSGQFSVDNEGFLTAPDSFRLQGFSADQDGNIGSGLGDLQVGNILAIPKVTSAIDINVNLDAQETPAVNAFDPLNPEDSAGFSSSVTVYDSLGNEHQTDIYFVKTAGNEWEYHGLIDGGELDGGTPGELTEIMGGTLSFNTDGQLDSHTQNSTTVSFLGANTQDIAFNFGNPISEGGDGTGSTGFGGTSTVDLLNQDGYGVGEFVFLKVLQDGLIEGTFSNGEVLKLGQVAIATFKNETDLRSVGQNMLAQTEKSGEPLVGAPDAGGRGEIFAGALEQSNVDLTNEFTQMIISQRGYQAASKLITTADQLMLETLNLKR
jgi:flagellar hook protein FlgE